MSVKGTVAVLGANGHTGRELVTALLDAGYAVRAGVHRSDESVPQHELVTVMRADAHDPEAVANLARGTSAVFSALGQNRASGTDVQTIAMNNLVSTAAEHGVKRVVSLTGTGVRVPGDTPELIDTALNTMLGMIAPKRMQDGIDHATVLKTSNLHWTILRVLLLTNGAPQPFGLTPHGPALRLTSRKTVAQAFLRVLETSRHIAQMPIISPLEAAEVLGEEPAHQAAQANSMRVYS